MFSQSPLLNKDTLEFVSCLVRMIQVTVQHLVTIKLDLTRLYLSVCNDKGFRSRRR